MAYGLSPVASSVADSVTLHVLRELAGLDGLDGRNSGGRDGDVLKGLLDNDHADNAVLGDILGPDGGELIVLGSSSDRRISDDRHSLGDGAGGDRGRLSNGDESGARDSGSLALGKRGADLSSSLENASGHVVTVGNLSALGVSSSGDLDGGGVRCGLGGIGRLRSVSNGDVAGKGVTNHSFNLLVESTLEQLDEPVALLEGALSLVILALDVEDGAVLDPSCVAGAGVNGLLKEVLVPTGHEVGMVTEALNVTVGEDELARLALECLGSPDGLVHETRNLGLEALGAVAVHDKVGVSHVGPVVLRVEVLAIPARREHDLGANTIGAVGIEVVLVGHVVAVQCALGSNAVVEAVEADGALSQVGLRSLSKLGPHGLLRVDILDVATGDGIVTTRVVSGNHAESGRKSLDALVGVGSILEEEVVRQQTADLRNELEGAVGVLEVERRSPVRRHVLGNSARSAVSIDQVIEVGLFAETCA